VNKGKKNKKKFSPQKAFLEAAFGVEWRRWKFKTNNAMWLGLL
jgi:hypothetical protein